MRDPRRCDAAHKATWQGRADPREAQVAHRAWTRGRQPRGSTRVHVDAHVGRHVAGGRHLEGPRVSGLWLGVWGGNANVLPRPNSYRRDFFSFIPCETMSHTFLTFCR